MERRIAGGFSYRFLAILSRTSGRALVGTFLQALHSGFRVCAATAATETHLATSTPGPTVGERSPAIAAPFPRLGRSSEALPLDAAAAGRAAPGVCAPATQ
ncbi:MAG: hypothetical protein ICV87_04625 [Gemmatimonadetes bacterium]|nr:hypothetical protein [Gemmatimonadota bacterium]